MKSILLLAALTACGADDHSSTGASDTTTLSAPPTSEPRAQDVTALLVADQAKLPACDAPSEGRLAYVRADAAFVACASGAWEPIDLRGERGEKGDPGVAGATGADGVAMPNVWRDPITDLSWLVGGTSGNADNGACSGGWEQPTYDEVTAASSHGIYAAVSSWLSGAAQDCAWTSDTATRRAPVKPGLANVDCGNMGAPFGIYCISR